MDKYSLVRNWGLAGIVGAGAQIASNLWSLHRRQYRATASDRARRFPTYSTMPRRYRSKLPTRRRNYRVPRWTPRRVALPWRSMARWGGLNQITLASTQTTAALGNTISLSFVPTADLVLAWDLFRIRKVEIYCSLKLDPGNSGSSNNCHGSLYLACDPSRTSAPVARDDVTTLDNCVQYHMVAGKTVKYTFYPKVADNVSTTGTDGTTLPLGVTGMNPWLRCDGNGINIPHFYLIGWFIANTAAPAAAQNGFQYTYKIYFDVRNAY